MLDRYVKTLQRAGLGQCVLLAAVSTAVWYILVESFDGGWTPLPGAWAELPGWVLFWSTGSVYSALVLFRYVPATGTGTRAVVFAVAGAMSYWIGVNFTVHSPIDSDVASTAVAGVITAAGLGCLVIWLGTLRFSPVFFAALCVAGGIGGAAIGVEALSNLLDELVVGHAAWQILTCVALYYTPSKAPPQSDER